MQNCPQCNIPNPNVNNFCRSCGAALKNVVNEEVNKLNSKITKLEAGNKSFKNQISELKQQLDDSEINELRNEKTELEEKLEIAKELKDKLTSTCSDMQSKLEIKENEIKGLRTELNYVKDKAKHKNTENEKSYQQSETKQWENKDLKRKYYIIIACITVLFVVSLFFVFITNFSNKNQIHSLENTITNIIKEKEDLQKKLEFPRSSKSIVDRCYFYDNNFNRTNRYITYGEKIKVDSIKDNFAYGTYTDPKENTISGWVRKGDLKANP